MLIVPARIEDAQVLFDWRNDPLTRAMSHNPNPVQWETHLAWLTRRMALSRPGLYIAQDSDSPVGTFRIDSDEISYTVAPSRRGSGVGLAMLSKAREMFGPLRAEIYQRNTASIAIAMRAGLRVVIIDECAN